MSNLQDLIIVSGLPRSGTSMMMRMLAEGGIPPLTDGLRKADEDNPNGYFEFEDVKQIEQRSEWIKSAAGMAVKMVSALLPKLPEMDTAVYRVIFMRRDLDEILSSQARMLERQGKVVSKRDQEDLRQYFSHHLDQIIRWLIANKNCDVLFVWYHDVIETPRNVAGAVADFAKRSLDLDRMVSIVDPALYRQRKSAE